jgi:hypothetical protein
MTDSIITVRTLRQLDGLVEEHIIKVFSKETLDRNPELAPKYSTWLGLEPVIRNREESGYRWECGSIAGWCWANLEPVNAVLAENSPEYFSEGQSVPVAFCLAALASVGVRVKLELGRDDNV